MKLKAVTKYLVAVYSEELCILFNILNIFIG